MPREWSLTVEGFGRIEHAAVTVKPLTVLVGPNNSGKSYLGTLVWGIEQGGLKDWPHEYEPLDAPMQQWMARAQHREGSWVQWSPDEQRELRAGWPGYVRDVLPELCRLLFDTETLRPSRLELITMALDIPWYAAAERLPPTDDPHAWTFQFSNRNDTPTMSRFDRDLGVLPSFMSGGRAREDHRGGPILANLAGFAGLHAIGTHAEYVPVDPIYLPASRTGFSLFYPTFLQATLTGTLTQRRDRATRTGAPNGKSASVSSRFTLPQIHLLSGLASAFGGQRGPLANEADRLERECLDGTIVVRAETGVARYAFRPDGTQEDLGLQLSSALVTELMPLIVMLRYAQELPFLVIEEPEAHLHPKLQRAVTRCLCRLVRRGVRVLITTHSATVAQQINNLVKLGGLEGERRAELQRRFYDGADEYLEGDDVAMHEFRFGDDGRTVVERVEQSAWGFPLPTFNDDLHRLTDETVALNAEL